MFPVSINFHCVPKLRVSVSVRESPAPGESAQLLSPSSSSKPDHCSPSPLTLGFPSFSKPTVALVDDLPLNTPFSQPDHCPSQGNRPSAPTAFGEPNRHLSVPPPFSKSICYPLGPPFSKPNNEIPARVSKPTHLAPISLEALAPSSSEPHGRPLMSPLSSSPQPNPRSVTSSSLRVPPFSKPGSEASVPSSPSKSNVKPHSPVMAHAVMGIRKDTPEVCFSALIRLAGH